MASSSVAVVTLVVHRKSEEPVPMITTRALPPLSGTCCPSRRCAARPERASMHTAAIPTINDDFRSIILSPVVSPIPLLTESGSWSCRAAAALGCDGKAFMRTTQRLRLCRQERRSATESHAGQYMTMSARLSIFRLWDIFRPLDSREPEVGSLLEPTPDL